MSARDKYEENMLGWSDIKDHMPRLRAAASGDCLEIGVRGGMSTSALLAGIEEHGGFLWSIDCNDCSGVFKGHPDWNFTQADTQKIDKCETVHDLVFIDGDHSYEGALHDLRVFGSRGDRVFVHDTEAPDYPGVRRAVEDYVKESGRTVIYHPGSFGMAEIT